MYWIYCIRVLLILGGPRGTLGGVLDAPHLRRGGSESAATPKTPQDALRCNFFELRYPSPLGGIFAAPRLRRGGCESAAAPKTPQDAFRCDFSELRYPSPLGGIFAAPRLRRGGSESVAAPNTPQDAIRCDIFELRYPSPLGGISAASRLRCGGSESAAIPKTPQDALRCDHHPWEEFSQRLPQDALIDFGNQFSTRPTDPFEPQYGPAECAKRLNPPAHLWWCDGCVERN